jgi:hypothetical protein
MPTRTASISVTAGPRGATLPILSTHCQHLWDALCSAYRVLGFDAVCDHQPPDRNSPLPAKPRRVVRLRRSSLSFAERVQHLGRQPLEPAFAVDALFAPHRWSIQRRPPGTYLTDC